jgi:hypothetical protein
MQNIIKQVEALMRAYDACTSDTECQAIRAQLDAVRVAQESRAYASGLPGVGDAQFACKIAARGTKHAYSADDRATCDAVAFQLTPNQVFVKNFFRTYDNLLLFHGVGVGKTCTAVTVAEACYEQFRKPALVILPQKLKSNFQKEIYNVDKDERQCTGATYDVPDRKVLSRAMLMRRVQRLVSQKYEVLSFREFGSAVQAVVDAANESFRDAAQRDAHVCARLQAMLSERLIVIDEVHNLKVDAESSDKIVPPLLELGLRCAHRCKLLLMTATPMFDDAAEIVWLLNLMRLNGKRAPLEVGDVFRKGELTKSGRQQLLEAVRGCVSYMRGSNPWTFPLRLDPDRNVLRAPPAVDIFGKPLAKEERLRGLCLVQSDMSAFQASRYEQLLATTKKAALETADASIASISSLLEAANVVYPSVSSNPKHSVGQQGVDACFSKSSKGTLSYQANVKKTYGEFLDEKRLAEYAPKLASILRCVQRSEGFVYVYSRFKSSGLIPLALALEHAGFSRYNAANLLAGGARRAPFLVGPNKRPATYAILSGDAWLSPRFESDIQAMKHLSNVHGEVVKVVLCSQVGTEGIDFKYVREIHVVEPWFNTSRMEQIVGRGARQCSHAALPMSKRNVTVYRHVAVTRSARESVDCRIYRIAEGKQRSIDVVERLLKENAVDCVLNAPVNYFDPARLGVRVDVVTSQGVVRKGVQLGDGPDMRISCACAASPPKRPSGDDVDVGLLLDDAQPYIGWIQAVAQNAYTYEQVKRACQAAAGRRFDERTMMMALQWMLTQRTVFRGPGGKQGHLAYVGGVYAFVPLTEAQDEAPLALMRWAASQPKAVQRDDVYEETYQEVRGLRVQFPHISADVATDYVVDRLPSHKLHLVIGRHMRELDRAGPSPTEDSILNSLRRAHVLVGKWPSIEFFFDSGTRSFWHVLPSGEVAPCSAEQTQRVLQSLRGALHFTKDYSGFLDATSKQFKIRDHRALKGFVCTQTSTLTVDQLQASIRKFKPQLAPFKNTKAVMCVLYELILRSMGKEYFARPFHHYASSLSS